MQGKFFDAEGARLHLRGVTYGPFPPPPTGDGTPFPSDDVVRADFVRMRDLGANTVRVYTPPPTRILDAAGEAGLRLLVGIPWTQHVCFLEDGEAARDARRRVARVANEQGRHPAVLALVLGNETPPDVVRWEGPQRVERFLRSLADTARQGAPDVLVSYANFPPTEYLDLDFLDFHSVNVFLQRRPEFRRYLARLQNIAEGRPLVLTEVGLDSVRNGERTQAETLGWQIRDAFDAGVAGVVVFSFTDQWFSLDPELDGGGFPVDDWAFGVVDAERVPKPAFDAVREAFGARVPSLPADPPLVSVVVCAFNAEQTLEACLESLCRLRYPRFEVVVVDDGSTDRTPVVAERFAGGLVRVVRQENRGLSAARNRGVEEARGAIVAFTDADCTADEDWLGYLVGKLTDGFVAVGGPNLSPPEQRRVPSVVAVAPGGPTHVLLDDDVAEHVPGCNMAFDRRTLVAIGGFRECYRVAGDDVDVCWRLQDAGHVIGFSPAAVVWHSRRDTVGGYLRQQIGYGRAEARLYTQHPERFDVLGSSRWIGRIYGGAATSLFGGSSRIYRGRLGEGQFQTLYERPASLLRQLPLTFEWNAVALLVLICAVAAGEDSLAYGLPLAASAAAAVSGAVRAPLRDPWRGVRSRALLALLVYLGPLVRGFERARGRATGVGEAARSAEDGAGRPPPGASVRLHRGEARFAYWSAEGPTKGALVEALVRFFARHDRPARLDSGWNPWDLEIAPSPWGRACIEVAVENHGARRRVVRVRATVRPGSIASRWLVASTAAVAVGLGLGIFPLAGAGAALGAAAAALATMQTLRLGRLVVSGVDCVARELGLEPIVHARGTESRRP